MLARGRLLGAGAARLAVICQRGSFRPSNATAAALHGPGRHRPSLVPDAVHACAWPPGPKSPGGAFRYTLLPALLALLAVRPRQRQAALGGAPRMWRPGSGSGAQRAAGSCQVAPQTGAGQPYGGARRYLLARPAQPSRHTGQALAGWLPALG